VNTTGRADQWTVATVGAVLFLVSIAGIIYGTRAAVSQRLYYGAKYGIARSDPGLSLSLLARAHRLYPHNYWACLLAVEQAYRLAESAGGEDATPWFQTADMWCRRGLAQNPHKRRLRWFMSRLLQRESPKLAAEYWQAYTEWHFWEPANHTILARLYALAGEIGKAEQSLAWGKGAATYESAAALVERERLKQHPNDR
jgi:hypothetical protein